MTPTPCNWDGGDCCEESNQDYELKMATTADCECNDPDPAGWSWPRSDEFDVFHLDGESDVSRMGMDFGKPVMTPQGCVDGEFPFDGGRVQAALPAMMSASTMGAPRTAPGIERRTEGCDGATQSTRWTRVCVGTRIVFGARRAARFPASASAIPEGIVPVPTGRRCTRWPGAPSSSTTRTATASLARSSARREPEGSRSPAPGRSTRACQRTTPRRFRWWAR